MDYTSKFKIEEKKRIETKTITGVVGSRNGFNIVIMKFENEWSLEDDSIVLFAVKDMNLKINIFVPIFEGEAFPTMSSMNKIDLPLEIYNDSDVVFIGLKKSDIFISEAARDAQGIKNRTHYARNLKEAEELVDQLTKSS